MEPILQQLEAWGVKGIKVDFMDRDDQDMIGFYHRLAAATAAALDRGGRARLIRTTRTRLGLSQAEFARRFRVPVGTLRDWEQARATAPDFAIAYVRVIGLHPEMVASAVA